MKILVQWTQKEPQDWVEMDSRDWENLPKHPEPTGKEIIDGKVPHNEPGWVFALNVQGLIFSGFDHYAVEHIADERCRVSGWNDDPEDGYGEGMRHALSWEFFPLAPDANLGEAMNTRQELTIFGEERYTERLPIIQAKIRHWKEFPQPHQDLTRHGIEIFDAEARKHGNRLSNIGYGAWAEGGFLPEQRAQGLYSRPLGTRTQYLDDTTQAMSLHAGINELTVLDTPSGTPTSLAVTIKTGFPYIWTTRHHFPYMEKWPSGTYRCQLNVTQARAASSYGFRTVGSSAGHFGRVNNALSAHVGSTVTQAEAAFTGTGLKLAAASWTPPDGAATDRFEAAVAIYNSTSCTTPTTMTVSVDNSDTFLDGPWVLPGSRQGAVIGNPQNY